MAKVIKATLSVSSIKKMKQEIDNYRKSLEQRNERFVKRLAEHGLIVTKIAIGMIPADYKVGGIDVDVDYDTSGLMSGATIRMSGEQAIFIEFGAGTYYNTGIGGTLHPKTKSGLENEFTIGSWSLEHQQHVYSKNGWYYRDSEGLHHSMGVPTFAPLYEGFMSMQELVLEIAKEVFLNG